MNSTGRSRRPSPGEDAAMVMRQALGGMLWSKQYYSYDVNKWLKEPRHRSPGPSRLP